jgi:shikimate dehydrogenase
MISGTTTLIAHLGYPTEAFKAPMIYNPWFDARGIDAVVVPMGVQAKDYAPVLASLAGLTNLRGALVTMPHKVTTLALVDEATPTARIAGARIYVAGCGGVGSAIAASLAAVGAGMISLFDARMPAAEALRDRLLQHYPTLAVRCGCNDPAGHDIVVNATPLGMKEGDPLPFDVAHIDAGAFVGEVVMKTELTPLLRAALARGLEVQVGADMLFEMIPAYLEFFGFGTATADELRAVSKIRY